MVCTPNPYWLQVAAGPSHLRGYGAALDRLCRIPLRSLLKPMTKRDTEDADTASKPRASWTEVRGQLKTLDMILFRGWDWVSRGMLRVESRALGPEGGRYSHCGLVVRGSDFPIGSPFRNDDKLYAFECTDPKEDGVRNVSGEKFTGVQLRDLDAVIENYDREPQTEMAWMRMRDESRPDVDPKLLEDVVKKYIDRPFQWNPLYLFGALYESIRPLRNRFRRRWRSDKVFCSQLVALVLRDLGVLADDVDPLNVIPTDFRAPDQTHTLDRDGKVPVLFERAVIFTAGPTQTT